MQKLLIHRIIGIIRYWHSEGYERSCSSTSSLNRGRKCRVQWCSRSHGKVIAEQTLVIASIASRTGQLTCYVPLDSPQEHREDQAGHMLSLGCHRWHQPQPKGPESMLVLSNNSSTPSAFGLSKKLAFILLASCEPVQGIFSSQSFSPWHLVKREKVKNALGLGLAAMVPSTWEIHQFIIESWIDRAQSQTWEDWDWHFLLHLHRLETGIFYCICTIHLQGLLEGQRGPSGWVTGSLGSRWEPVSVLGGS